MGRKRGGEMKARYRLKKTEFERSVTSNATLEEQNTWGTSRFAPKNSLSLIVPHLKIATVLVSSIVVDC